MASLKFQFIRVVDAIRRAFARPQGRRDALSILEDLDRCWNLHRSVAIVSFFISAGFGVLAFFVVNDLVLWMDVSKQVAAALIAVSWVLIFPICALVFLLIMSVLYAAGVRDVRAAFRTSLSNLALSRDQLRDLQDVLASREWRHSRIFKSVVADLANDRMRYSH